MSSDEMRPEARVAVVVERDGVRQTHPARVRRHDGRALELVFDDMPPGGAISVLAIHVGSGDDHRVVGAEGAVLGGPSTTVTTGRTWRRVRDRRGTPRYPTFLDCILHTPDRQVNAQCVDISLSGAAIETVEWAARRFMLEVHGVAVPCEVVTLEPFMGITAIHARFLKLPEEARPVIVDLVEAARDEFDSAQRYLAERADDHQPGMSAA
jgi:hypothetical protein